LRLKDLLGPVTRVKKKKKDRVVQYSSEKLERAGIVFVELDGHARLLLCAGVVG